MIESLVGLIILSTVTLSLMQVLPLMLEARWRLETEQEIYNTLFQLQDQRNFHHATFSWPLNVREPVPFVVTPNGHQLCATYSRGGSNVQTICL